jgi:hypothetical protein
MGSRQMFEREEASSSVEHAPIPLSEIDGALTAQLSVAWAGELGDPKRLGWWRSNFVSEFGGEDLFKRLLPSTWEWAVLEAAREAVLQKEAEFLRMDPEPDRIVSLFHLGFAEDERISERLRDLKRAAGKPHEVLPSLTEVVGRTWSPQNFFDWVVSRGSPETVATSIGRRLKGAPPLSLQQRVSHLLSALAPPSDQYPLPHFRRSG